MKKSVILLVWALIAAGCGTRDNTQELQQQKMTLELLKAQNEQIVAMKEQNKQLSTSLRQKENDLRILERKNQDTLREFERQKTLLAKLQDQMQQKAEEEKQQQEITDRIKKRKPYLEELASAAAQAVDNAWKDNFIKSYNGDIPSDTSSGQAIIASQYQTQKVLLYNNCLEYMMESNVMNIVSDAEFEAEAAKVKERWKRLNSPP